MATATKRQLHSLAVGLHIFARRSRGRGHCLSLISFTFLCIFQCDLVCNALAVMPLLPGNNQLSRDRTENARIIAQTPSAWISRSLSNRTKDWEMVITCTNALYSSMYKICLNLRDQKSSCLNNHCFTMNMVCACLNRCTRILTANRLTSLMEDRTQF